LHVAAEHGSRTAVRRLLAAGADPAISDRLGRTGLMAATGARRVKQVSVLLSSGRCGDLEATDVSSQTALAIAARQGGEFDFGYHFSTRPPCTAMVSCLLGWGCDPWSAGEARAGAEGQAAGRSSPDVGRLLHALQAWVRRRRVVVWRFALVACR